MEETALRGRESPVWPAERARFRRHPAAIGARAEVSLYLRPYATVTGRVLMPLNVNVNGGTHAGVRAPWVGGHSPKCVCSKCEKEREDGNEARP